MSEKPPSKPKQPPEPPSKPAQPPSTPVPAAPTPSSGATADASLIPFVTQAFTNLFNRLDELSKEMGLLKTAIEQVDNQAKTRIETIQPQIEEMLSNIREERRSSVTHYSQLAATVAQGFESLGEIRSASIDKTTLDLLTDTLQAANDALYCLRMERLIRRYMELHEELSPSGEKAPTKGSDTDKAP
jgi:hypothetical protein